MSQQMTELLDKLRVWVDIYRQPQQILLFSSA